MALTAIALPEQQAALPHFAAHGCDSSLHPADCLARYSTTGTLPHVIGTVQALRNLPHRTILRVQDGQAAQVNRDDAGHWLSYAGTDLTDSLNPTDLDWDRHSHDSLNRMLPAVIIDQPEQRATIIHTNKDTK